MLFLSACGRKHGCCSRSGYLANRENTQWCIFSHMPKNGQHTSMLGDAENTMVVLFSVHLPSSCSCRVSDGILYQALRELITITLKYRALTGFLNGLSSWQWLHISPPFLRTKEMVQYIPSVSNSLRRYPLKRKKQADVRRPSIISISRCRAYQSTVANLFVESTRWTIAHH